MTEASGLTVVERVVKHPPGTRTARRVSAWSFEGVQTVEIIAPDRYSAALLLQYAAPFFPAEIVAPSATIVRFRPPASGEDWVSELFSLIERWLESTPGSQGPEESVA